ncbi:nucleoside/nucleotide kinase family protein [Sutcliffiella rhizosphaerae]|uniref:Uridine kinase n=1 Tax=Sutcliffiella rhizosphaerae TaxID=2880967 RepID=A0ABM8YR41_9BACI|nr:hypothetical protein [Sutcliffiella rhizosphaerae]CAG9622461.1 Uridine kinase [Sutcliffiella rhizosphaerae]
MTLIIAVSGFSGGGKTTVTKRLLQALPDSILLHFDDYDFNGPNDLIKWVEDGADYNLWCLKPLIEDIEKYISSKSYILLDYPFSYKNDSLKKYIDLSIFIDTPLDIAMARRMLRDHIRLQDIHQDLAFYLNFGRAAYLEMEKSIKPDCDLVVDGTLPLDNIVSIILNKLKKR